MAFRGVKAYGTVFGVSPEAFETVRHLGGLDEVTYEDGDLTIEHEGGHVFLEDLAEALSPLLSDQAKGRFLYIDYDEWRLTKYVFAGRELTVNSFDLDDVTAKYNYV